MLHVNLSQWLPEDEDLVGPLPVVGGGTCPLVVGGKETTKTRSRVFVCAQVLGPASDKSFPTHNAAKP